MDKVIRPLLVRDGFSLSYDSALRQGDGGGLIVSRRAYAPQRPFPRRVDPAAARHRPRSKSLQAVGSTLSYGKRYIAEMLLNIVREGEDDDGQTRRHVGPSSPSRSRSCRR